MEQLGECVLGSQSAAVSASLLPVWAGHLRDCWVWVWSLLSLLWRTRSLSQINVKARLKWHPTHVRERGASSGVRFVSVNQITGRFGDRSVRWAECCQHLSLRLMWTWMVFWGGLLTFLVGKIRRYPDRSLFYVLFHWAILNRQYLMIQKKSDFLKFGPLITVTLVKEFKAKHHLSGGNCFWANSSTCWKINYFKACKATTKRQKQPKSKTKQVKTGRNQLQRDGKMYYKGPKNNQKQTSDDS